MGISHSSYAKRSLCKMYRKTTTKKNVIGKIGRVTATSIDFKRTIALTNLTAQDGKPYSSKSIFFPTLLKTWDALLRHPNNQYGSTDTLLCKCVHNVLPNHIGQFRPYSILYVSNLSGALLGTVFKNFPARFFKLLDKSFGTVPRFIDCS